ncbi:MAG TPA: TonB-dependent receptor, partial [Prosthecobacter sp.]|nr:TonB-dependent receptor [Prosthecobacter sp.]
MLRLALLWLLLSAPAAWAQSGNGALRGSIFDSDFSVPVVGATVIIEGTGHGANTDESGSFFINDIPPGQYTVLTSKDGFVRERRSGVVVTPGAVKGLDLEMMAEVVELDEFVVSDEELIETTQATEAMALRTELQTFTEVLGAQFISQTGASDAAKLLSKTTGVNVADGKFVVVRGLNDRYNVVSLNSLRVPSSDPDRRAVALDLFPTAVIQDIRTTKTFLPDLFGESTGGSINIVTKAVPDADFAKAKIGTGYNTQTTGNNKFLTYQGGGTGMFGTAESRALPDFVRNDPLPFLGGSSATNSPERVQRQLVHDTLSPVMGTSEATAPLDFSLEASLGHRTEFMGAPAGITVAADYSKKYLYNDDDLVGRYVFATSADELTNPALTAGEAKLRRRLSTVRSGQETMRAGLLVAAGIQPDEDSEIIFTYFFNRVAEDRATLQFGELDPAQFLPWERDYRESLAYTQRDLRVMQLAGKHLEEINDRELDVRWAVAYNQSSQLEPDHRFVRGLL